MTRRSVATFSLLVLALALAGCEQAEDGETGGLMHAAGAPQGDDADDLRALRQVYLDHHDAYGQGPASWEAAIEFAKQSDTYDVVAIERLRDAGCQVTWGAKMTDAVQGVDSFVIAQHPNGPKLMISGAIVE